MLFLGGVVCVVLGVRCVCVLFLESVVCVLFLGGGGEGGGGVVCVFVLGRRGVCDLGRRRVC